jgi:pimeloyl-ACP methyl ester carboxylesterase
MADDCVALIRHLGLSSASLLGHSMGGFVAMDIAARYPECVDKLILAGTSRSNSPRNNALFSDWALGIKSGMDLALWFRNIFYWIFTVRFFDDPVAVNDALRFALEYPYPQSAEAFARQVDAVAAYDDSEG